MRIRKIFKRFSYRYLEDSSVIYNPIFEVIYDLNYKYYTLKAKKGSRALTTLQKGLDDFYYISGIINQYNKCFWKLITAGDVIVAFAMVRIQLDNLCAIYAETKYPFEILHRVFEEGKRIEDIKRDGVLIKPAALRKEIDDKFGTNIAELYSKYSGFIHPSIAQTKVRIKTYYSAEDDDIRVVKKYLKLYEQDMIAINRTIIQILREYYDCTNDKLTQLNKLNKKQKLNK